MIIKPVPSLFVLSFERIPYSDTQKAAHTAPRVYNSWHKALKAAENWLTDMRTLCGYSVLVDKHIDTKLHKFSATVGNPTEGTSPNRFVSVFIDSVAITT